MSSFADSSFEPSLYSNSSKSYCLFKAFSLSFAKMVSSLSRCLFSNSITFSGQLLDGAIGPNSSLEELESTTDGSRGEELLSMTETAPSVKTRLLI